MLETSLDLLYIVLALCVLWITIFICWWLFYGVMIIRRVYQIVKSIKEKLKIIDGLAKTAKNKMEHTAMYIDLAADGIGKIVNFVKDKKKVEDEPIANKKTSKKNKK